MPADATISLTRKDAADAGRTTPEQHERHLRLKAMLDDRDWASAYVGRSALREALATLVDGAAGNAPSMDPVTLRVLALEEEDYEDFRVFREEWLLAGDGDRARCTGATPEQWLRARLRAWDEAERENRSRACRYEGIFWSANERFRVV